MAMNTLPREQCDAFEDAIKKRYGKTVTITGKREVNADNSLRWVSLDVVSSKNRNYQLTEHLEGGLTKSVTLLHPAGENTYTRYLDAEISMVDKIAEE